MVVIVTMVIRRTGDDDLDREIFNVIDGEGRQWMFHYTGCVQWTGASVCLVLRRETKRERGRGNRIEQEKRCYDLFADVLVRLESAREREREKNISSKDTHTQTENIKRVSLLTRE